MNSLDEQMEKLIKERNIFEREYQAIHKQAKLYRNALHSLLTANDNNSGYVPSLYVFQREVDFTKHILQTNPLRELLR